MTDKERQNKREEEVTQSSGSDGQARHQSNRAFEDKAIRDMAVEVLKTVYDPEIPVNIYELGLIYEVSVYPVNNLYVRMTLTSPACPVAGSLPGEVEEKLRGVKGVNDVQLDLVFDPPWDMSMISDEAKLELGLM